MISAAQSLPPWSTAIELAQRWKTSTKFVLRKYRAGSLKGVSFGSKTVRFSAGAVLALEADPTAEAMKAVRRHPSLPGLHD